jgi:hypothetical protein
LSATLYRVVPAHPFYHAKLIPHRTTIELALRIKP